MKTLASEVVRYRKIKGLKQDQVADKLKTPRSSYAKKEKDGSFTEDEIPNLAKIIGAPVEELLSLSRDIIVIDNWKEFLIKSAINNNAVTRVVLMALAEILASNRKEAVGKVLSELTKAVEAERQLHSLR